MKSGLLAGIIFTFLLTLSIFTISKTDIKEKISTSIKNFSQTFRRLGSMTTDEFENQICSQSSEELLEFYKTTGPNYQYTVEEGNAKIPEIFTKDITNGVTESQITDYVYSNAGYIFLSILWIICLVLWLPFCCCVTCRSCFCPKVCSKWPTPMLLASLLFSGVVIILCAIGYTGNSGVANGIYGFGCTLLKLVHHLTKGDEYKVKPYWIGLTEISNKMNDTENSIKDLGTKSTKLKNQIDNLDSKTFKQKLVNEYSDRKDTVLTNPNPGESKFTPVYLSNYGPVTSENTILGAINSEFTEFESESKNTLTTIIDVIDLTDKQTSDTVDQISSFNKFINNIVKQTNDYIQSLADGYSSYLDSSDSGFRTSMNLLFSFNLVVAILFTISLVALLIFKAGKCTLCISWIFLYTLLIFTFLCGIVFGIFGSIFKDASYGLSILLKDIKDIKIIDDQDTMNLIDTCINGNGSIANGDFLDITADSGLLDSIYNLEGNITEGIKKIDKYELVSANKADEKYDEIKKDAKSNIDELKTALNEIRKYVDLSSSSSYVSDDTPIYDDWEVRKEDCQDGYNYVSPTSKGRLRNLATEDKSCLVIPEWNSNAITTRYSGIISTDKTKVSDIANSYFKSITTFINENSDLLDTMKNKNTEIKSAFKDFTDDEIDILNGVKDAIKPIREIFEEIVGDNSFIDMLNCGFFKRDINKMLEVMHDSLGSEFKTISALFLWISLIEFLLTFFVLSIMSAYNRTNSYDVERV